ncbi:DUF6732 family protein [Oceaniglobus roseus]|uniref:DUF6732 family protein n=1 Tax=Oceaniglobus roseus TaxID=1737570 RepID=UPI000C7F1201|nr:DUF6732 family protein [Kandeliimicrobium roseum]
MTLARCTALLALLAPGAALAHPGHLAGLAGHDHWVAGAAIGTAIALGLWAGLKERGKRRKREETEDATEEQSA